MYTRFFDSLVNASDLIFATAENLEDFLCWLQAIALHDGMGIAQYTMMMYIIFAPVISERLEK